MAFTAGTQYLCLTRLGIFEPLGMYYIPLGAAARLHPVTPRCNRPNTGGNPRPLQCSCRLNHPSCERAMTVNQPSTHSKALTPQQHRPRDPPQLTQHRGRRASPSRPQQHTANSVLTPIKHIKTWCNSKPFVSLEKHERKKKARRG